MAHARQTGRIRWSWILALALAPLVVLASWIGTEHMIQRTSGAEFCAGCHTMAPMAATYRLSTHAGNNRLGMQAECTDCHLPHDNPVRHILVKAQRSLKDTWAQWTQDTTAIDWEVKRGERERFVYESGCLQCHEGLRRGANPDHPALFAGGTNPFDGRTFRCVHCHTDVGHPGLFQ
jgi:cytochrome c-type protein NapC